MGDRHIAAEGDGPRSHPPRPGLLRGRHRRLRRLQAGRRGRGAPARDAGGGNHARLPELHLRHIRVREGGRLGTRRRPVPRDQPAEGRVPTRRGVLLGGDRRLRGRRAVGGGLEVGTSDDVSTFVSVLARAFCFVGTSAGGRWEEASRWVGASDGVSNLCSYFLRARFVLSGPRHTAVLKLVTAVLLKPLRAVCVGAGCEEETLRSVGRAYQK